MKLSRVFSLPFLFLTLAGCRDTGTGLDLARNSEILLHVTGGFPGVDYTLLVDGPQREVVGVSCVSFCDFEDGAVLHGLSDEQLSYIVGLFEDAGVQGYEDTDFGYECCDQLHYELEITNENGTITLKGSSEAMPQALREAIGVVAGFASGTFPVIVDQGADPESWEGGWAGVLAPWRL